eukprot:EG_transcript_15855
MHLSAAAQQELAAVAAQIGTHGKGILACDESAGTVGTRLVAVGAENTEETRRWYRNLLFSLDDLPDFISAVILDPETLYQAADSGTLFPEYLTARGIVPGIKPHLKVVSLPGRPGETIMQGLDDLAVRCAKYRQAGARFCKWRSPLAISPTGPSELAVQICCTDLARYALICQENGLVPIVEPDVAMVGDHDLERAIEVNTHVLATLYKALHDHGVFLEGTLLKPNMVLPGKGCPAQYSDAERGVATVTVLRRTVPAAVPSIHFLSGGQSPEEASANLNAINQAKARLGRCPWQLSFSFSRAIQEPVLEVWAGQPGNAALAQAELRRQLTNHTRAVRGEYRLAPDGPPPPKRLKTPSATLA